MSKITVKKEKNFSPISNITLQDEWLSFWARWLLSYLLSLSDNREIIVEDLKRRSPDGKTKVNWYMKELMDQGYMSRGERQRKPNWWLWWYDYVVYETSQNWYLCKDQKGKRWTSVKKSYDWKSYIGETYVGKSYVGKSTNSNNTNLENTQIEENTQYKETSNEVTPDGVPVIPDIPETETSTDLEIYKEKEKSSAKKEKESRSIVNKQNRSPWIEIYNYLQSFIWAIDWNLEDCIYLYYKLEKITAIPGTPLEKLKVIIEGMIKTGQSKFYSISSPKKLTDNLSTIVSKLMSENIAQQQGAKPIIYLS